MKYAGLKGTKKVFYVNYNPIDTNDILNINRYLMKKTFWNIKRFKMF